MQQPTLVQPPAPLLSTATFISVLLLSSPLQAGGKHSGTVAFDIPEQKLNSALTEFAEQTGLQLLYSEELTEELTTKPVKGRYSPKQALNALLDGSGIHYRYLDDTVITLERPKNNGLTAETLIAADNFVPTGTRSKEESYNDPIEQEELTVQGGGWNGYNVLNASTATKTDTPLLETPVSVQVVPRAVMDDQKTARIKDALENVSGVRAQPSLGGGVGYIVRGFRTGNVYRNGLLTNEGGFGDFDAGNLETVEVVKGPAQLYGRAEPGGLISIITKKPLAAPYYSLEQQFGSYDLYRTQWDAGGPVTDDDALLYRFSGAYQSNNSFRDFVSVDRKLFNPSITWRLTDATDITIDIEGTEKRAPADFGIPVIGNRPARIPISRNLGDPNTPLGDQSSVKIGSEINHRFNENWAIHNRFLASLNDGETTFVNPAPAFDPASAFDQATGLMQRNIFSQESEQEHYALNLDITGKFEIAHSKHEVLAGFDFYRTFNKYGANGIWRIADPDLAIDIYNPTPSYGIPQSAFAAARLTSETFGPTGNNGNRAVIFNGWYGIYFQDQITLWDNLHIMGGGRYDWAETGRGNAFSYADAEDRMSNFIRKDDGFSPRVGILYQPWDELSLYGNWTTSFGANNAPSADGSTFDPQVGEQFEAGIKTQWFDSRFIATLAYYHLTKDNILVNDLSTPDPFDKIANQQRSQGIELDMNGQITDQVSFIGSYAYTDARIIKDNIGGTEGNRINNVPEHSGSLWVRYDVDGFGADDGFSVGVGGIAAGRREGDNANSFQMPGYVRMDAFLAYKYQLRGSRITTQFNIRNLLDKQYYESTDPDSNVAPALGVYPGAPLTAIGSVRVEF